MSLGPAAGDAARLAAAVARLGDADWSLEAARLGGRPAIPDPPPDAPPPTYGELATVGVAVIEVLGTRGRWDDAAGQARRLSRFFRARGLALGPIAAPAFDGLLAATLARDPDELTDFCALVRELFS